MNGAILVLNAGSSSLRVAAYLVSENGLAARPLLRGHISGIGATLKAQLRGAAGEALALRRLFDNGAERNRHLAQFLDEIGAHLDGRNILGIGHRIVHGGARFRAATFLTPPVINQLTEYIALAPGHQPHNLKGVEVTRRIWPDAPQIGCFDTAFHRTQDELAQIYAIPRAMTERGLIRYGFHGLSYAYIAQALSGLADARAKGRVIVAHLGHGASLCAMRDGKSVATTMGFTALEGLPMGTRCGAIDPGLLLYLQTEEKMSAVEVSRLLYDKSGLLGVSGVSDDMQDLLASSSPHAAQAIDLFAYRIAREIGSLSAALGGLDALVFTAGIGEHAAPLRAKVCEQTAWLGLALDRQANAAHGPCISAGESKVAAYVIATDEERMIALESFDLLKA